MPDSNTRAAEFLDAKALAETGAPCRVFLMAALMAEDSDSKLADAYPALFAETMRRRWDSKDGTLPGDQLSGPPPMTALGRED